MSNKKKPKKLRRPNVPMPATAVGGGAETLAPAPRPHEARFEAARPMFDYSDVKKDLKRIGLLAGGFIAILVALSFFIK
jgi:hypothetical protein